MTLREVLRSASRRLKRRAIWSIAVGLTVMMVLGGTWMVPGLKGDLVGYLVPLVTFAYICVGLFLAPVPWQWDGRHQRLPGIFRGFLQSYFVVTPLLLLLIWSYPWIIRQVGEPHPFTSMLRQTLFHEAFLPLLVGFTVVRCEFEEARKQEAHAWSRASQTRLLQSQLHPHMLLNALNGMAELAHQDPEAAEQGMRSLAGLVRQILDVSSQDTFPLSDERRIVSYYLDLEALRLADRLKVEWDWQSGLDDLQVIPLLLQPSVKNAIEHGIAPHPDGGVLRLAARTEGERLILEVANTGMPYRRKVDGRPGIGMTNLASRLRIAYGRDVAYEVRSEEGWTVARVSIDASYLV